jgi:catechol 2,3-dioxygenase-like lactoylglutathione lyase family enzyme
VISAVFDHVHIHSADPDESVAFWTELFGAEPVGSIPGGGGGSNRILLLGAQFFVISEAPAGALVGGPGAFTNGALEHGIGVAHIGLNVTDIDSWVSRLSARGLAVHGSVQNAGALRYVYFTAPDGVVVELTEYSIPRRFTPVLKALRAADHAVHVMRRTVARTLLSAL